MSYIRIRSASRTRSTTRRSTARALLLLNRPGANPVLRRRYHHVQVWQTLRSRSLFDGQYMEVRESGTRPRRWLGTPHQTFLPSRSNCAGLGELSQPIRRTLVGGENLDQMQGMPGEVDGGRYVLDNASQYGDTVRPIVVGSCGRRLLGWNSWPTSCLRGGEPTTTPGLLGYRRALEDSRFRGVKRAARGRS